MVEGIPRFLIYPIDKHQKDPWFIQTDDVSRIPWQDADAGLTVIVDLYCHKAYCNRGGDKGEWYLVETAGITRVSTKTQKEVDIGPSPVLAVGNVALTVTDSGNDKWVPVPQVKKQPETRSGLTPEETRVNSGQVEGGTVRKPEPLKQSFKQPSELIQTLASCVAHFRSLLRKSFRS